MPATVEFPWYCIVKDCDIGKHCIAIQKKINIISYHDKAGGLHDWQQHQKHHENWKKK